ncbi:hypothetical protein KR059_012959 [Drosophila kikkawai]|nr:hypothetical protein KR059_012959 [Drosophila kikkawai]
MSPLTAFATPSQPPQPSIHFECEVIAIVVTHTPRCPLPDGQVLLVSSRLGSVRLVSSGITKLNRGCTLDSHIHIFAFTSDSIIVPCAGPGDNVQSPARVPYLSAFAYLTFSVPFPN